MSDEIEIHRYKELKFPEQKDTWKDVLKIMETPQWTDFTLRTKDSTEVRCLKVILAARSKVFKGMFELSNEENELVLNEMTGDTLKTVVDCRYGRRVTLASRKQVLPSVRSRTRYTIYSFSKHP